MINLLRMCRLMILSLFLSTIAASGASAQFAFELPSRSEEKFTSYDEIQVVVTGKLALNSHTERGHIFLDVIGGLPPYSFKWNNRQTSQNRVNLLSGTYTVEIIDAIGTKHMEQIIIYPPFGLIFDPSKRKTISANLETYKREKSRMNLSGKFDTNEQ